VLLPRQRWKLARGANDEEHATIGRKWLQVLKELSPGINRVLLIFDPDNPSWIVYVRALEAAATSFGVQLSPAGVHDASEIERAITAFAGEANSGLIVLPGPVNTRHRNLIAELAALHRLAAIYPYRYFAVAGGLISYGPDPIDLFRRAASYVDRILKGEKPADLPVQQPTKYELVVNLKTAKALGLAIPPSVLARADEVIE
jgi:putative ABC transport system substrate-binding protein